MYDLQYYYRSGEIPIEFKGIIPEICECGGHFLLNENMTQLRCSNPICPYHMAQKMDAMLKQLKVKDIGPATCETIIIENDLVHHTQVLELGVNDMPSRNQDSIKEKFYNEIHKTTKLPIQDIAKLLRAPDMQTRCDDIFKGYDDIDKFYKDFAYSEDFIAERTNLSKGILTKRFTKSLIHYEYILRGLCETYHITKVSQETLVICMTGDIMTATRDDGTYYRSREHFLKDMQELTEGIVNISNKSSMSNKVHYLVTDTPNSGTAKNRRADELGVDKLTFVEFKTLLLNYIKTKEEIK